MFEGLFQPTHLLVTFGIALLVFGPKKLPELGKGIGEGIRALKDSMKDHPSVQAKHDVSTPETRSSFRRLLCQPRSSRLIKVLGAPAPAASARAGKAMFSR